MELMEVIVIITAIIAASIGVIYIIAKIANFYKLRFGFRAIPHRKSKTQPNMI